LAGQALQDKEHMMIDPDVLKKAMKAFRKRLKLMRKDDESRLSHGAMTKGYRSAIVGIRPPADFPPEVWDELVRQGRLRKESHGMYALAEDLGPMG
jgi:hypothetical protein